MNRLMEMNAIPYLLVAQAEVIMNLLEQGVTLILPGVLAKNAIGMEVAMKKQMELKRNIIKIVTALAPALLLR